jgi:lipopolysaccharide export system permease protein
MGEILNRYIFREVVQTWLVVTGILLLILLTDQFARVLSDAAGADIPKDAIFAVLGYSSIQYLTILIPVGIFLSILLALARMYRDSEMAAIMACGIGNVSLYRPILLFAVFLSFLVGWLSLVAAPAAVREVARIENEARRFADLAMLEPGRFISFGRDNTIIYAEEVNEDGTLENVFVQRREGERVTVVVAASAVQENDKETNRKVLRFFNGERHEGVPGSKEFRVMKFAEHGIPFELNEGKQKDAKEETLTVAELLESGTPDDIAELQWRISVPLTLFMLTLIAVPLSRAPPRTGRYNNLIAGILIYVIYSNLLGASKVWVEQEVVPIWVGLWWVHLSFFVVAVFLLMRQNFVFRRLFKRSRGAVQA